MAERLDLKSKKELTLDDYQKGTIVTDSFGQIDRKTDKIMAPAMMEKVLGLSGEAGEVADKFKKIIRDKGGDLSVEDKEAVVKELGDVLWYIAEISRYLDTPLSEVARKNLEKLYSRLDRNKIAGDGDNR